MKIKSLYAHLTAHTMHRLFNEGTLSTPSALGACDEGGHHKRVNSDTLTYNIINGLAFLCFYKNIITKRILS